MWHLFVYILYKKYGLKDYTTINTFKVIKIDEIETYFPKPEKKFSIYSDNNYYSKLNLVLRWQQTKCVKLLFSPFRDMFNKMRARPGQSRQNYRTGHTINIYVFCFCSMTFLVIFFALKVPNGIRTLVLMHFLDFWITCWTGSVIPVIEILCD